MLRTFCALWVVFAALACAPAESTVAAGPAPQRIVALTVGAADCLALLGALDRVVAVEADCFVPGTETKVKIRNDDHAGPSRALNVEAVLALAPDLIIAKEDLQPALEGRGVRVLWVSRKSDLVTVVPFLRDLGRELGLETQAEQAIEAMETRRKRIADIVKDLAPVSVYFEAGRPGRTAGQGTVIDEMISLAGGVNIAGDMHLANPVLSSEAIVAADPEVIVLSPWSDNPEAIRARPGWAGIRAVREGRIHQVPEQNRKVQYPSPSCVQGCESMLLPWLHPEAGADAE
ncbi:MAG: ABC transporter substrate-binding protein [Planctomycetota bacterium]